MAMTDDLLARLRTSPVVGRYFESDGQLVVVAGGAGEGEGGDSGGEGEGDGGDGTGQGSGSGESGTDDGDQGGDDSGGDEAAKLELTQAELDRMIDKRLGRAKTKWESDLKGYADAENQTETERLQAERDAADQRAQQVTEAANTKLVLADAKVAAIAVGAKADRVAALLKLVDLTDIDVDDDDGPDAKAIEKAVAKGLDEYPEFKAGPNGRNGSSGGEFNGDSKAITDDDFAKMSYQDRVQLHGSDPALYEQLSAAT